MYFKKLIISEKKMYTEWVKKTADQHPEARKFAPKVRAARLSYKRRYYYARMSSQRSIDPPSSSFRRYIREFEQLKPALGSHTIISCCLLQPIDRSVPTANSVLQSMRLACSAFSRLLRFPIDAGFPVADFHRAFNCYARSSRRKLCNYRIGSKNPRLCSSSASSSQFHMLALKLFYNAAHRFPPPEETLHLAEIITTSAAKNIRFH